MTFLLTAYSKAGSISQLITVLIIFALVLAVTVFTTRYVGNFQKMQGLNRNLEVIETLRIANNKYIQIVRATDKYIVIAVGKDEISMLTEIDDSKMIYASSDSNGLKESFSELMKKMSKAPEEDKSNEQ